MSSFSFGNAVGGGGGFAGFSATTTAATASTVASGLFGKPAVSGG